MDQQIIEKAISMYIEEEKGVSLIAKELDLDVSPQALTYQLKKAGIKMRGRKESARITRSRKESRSTKCIIEECTNEAEVFPSQRSSYCQEHLRGMIKISGKKKNLKRTKLIVDFLLEHPCIHCGEDEPIVLEFHHQEPETKSFTRSSQWLGSSLEAFYRELNKCVVLCRNCHLKETAIQVYSYRIVGINPEWPNSVQVKTQMLLDVLENNLCVECGESDITTFEMHHPKDDDKYAMTRGTGLSGGVGQMRFNSSIENFKKELDKCVVLCGNCHTRITAKEQNSLKTEVLNGYSTS